MKEKLVNKVLDTVYDRIDYVMFLHQDLEANHGFTFHHKILKHTLELNPRHTKIEVGYLPHGAHDYLHGSQINVSVRKNRFSRRWKVSLEDTCVGSSPDQAHAKWMGDLYATHMANEMAERYGLKVWDNS